MGSLIGRLALLALLVTGAGAAGAVGGGLAAWWLLQRAAAEPGGPAEGTPVAGLAAVRGDDGPAEEDAGVLAAVRSTRPAVVTVMNLQRMRASLFAPVQLQRSGSGSGVIIDPRGYIATNAHVVRDAAALEVVFIDGRRSSAEIVQWDSAYDVAILKVPPDTALPAVAELADSTRLEPGMRVLAIGSPLGTEYQNTVTTGIIAGLNRRVKDLGFDLETLQLREYDVVDAPLIQTDAAINTGNSGGPLVDLRGRVVGLSTLIVRRDPSGQALVEGLGFAVPSNVVRALAREWIDGVMRADLGASFESLDPMSARERDFPRAAGAVVTALRADGAAARAGLRAGDIIVAVDGVALDLDRALQDLLWRYQAGDQARLTVDRFGETLELTVDFEAPAGASAARP